MILGTLLLSVIDVGLFTESIEVVCWRRIEVKS